MVTKKTQAEIDSIVEAAQLLSCPTRVEILHHVTQGCSSVEEIHTALGRGVRHGLHAHIHKLAAAGLLRVEHGPIDSREPLTIHRVGKRSLRHLTAGLFR